MKELLRTNNMVLISFVEALLNEAGIGHFVADTHVSILEGSIGAIPRRVLVDAGELERARRILTANDLGHELSDPA